MDITEAAREELEARRDLWRQVEAFVKALQKLIDDIPRPLKLD